MSEGIEHEKVLYEEIEYEVVNDNNGGNLFKKTQKNIIGLKNEITNVSSFIYNEAGKFITGLNSKIPDLDIDFEGNNIKLEVIKKLNEIKSLNEKIQDINIIFYISYMKFRVRNLLDDNISYGTFLLLDFISNAEGTNGNYNAIFSNGGQEEIIFTGMKISDIIKYQKFYKNTHVSGAIGKYQFMSSTINDLIKRGKINKNDIFTPALQDKMAIILLKEKGLDDFIAGNITVSLFQENISGLWASIPKNKNGKSYYYTDGLNNALVSDKETDEIITKMKKNS